MGVVNDSGQRRDRFFQVLQDSRTEFGVLSYRVFDAGDAIQQPVDHCIFVVFLDPQRKVNEEQSEEFNYTEVILCNHQAERSEVAGVTPT